MNYLLQISIENQINFMHIFQKYSFFFLSGLFILSFCTSICESTIWELNILYTKMRLLSWINVHHVCGLDEVYVSADWSFPMAWSTTDYYINFAKKKNLILLKSNRTEPIFFSPTASLWIWHYFSLCCNWLKTAIIAMNMQCTRNSALHSLYE